jgi:hypothetical protein
MVRPRRPPRRASRSRCARRETARRRPPDPCVRHRIVRQLAQDLAAPARERVRPSGAIEEAKPCRPAERRHGIARERGQRRALHQRRQLPQRRLTLALRLEPLELGERGAAVGGGMPSHPRAAGSPKAEHEGEPAHDIPARRGWPPRHGWRHDDVDEVLEARRVGARIHVAPRSAVFHAGGDGRGTPPRLHALGDTVNVAPGVQPSR